MELILAYLRDEWGLSAKLDSKRLLTVKGAADDDIVGDNWITENYSEFLGWPIQSDASHQMCWSRLVQKAWASFHANVRAPS